MASQIYSRYIPPSKKKSTAIGFSASPPPSVPILESLVPTPPATRPDASSTYVRHIPPSKKKQEPQNTPNPTPVDENTSSPKSKRKLVALSGEQDDSRRGHSKKQKKKHIGEPESSSSLKHKDVSIADAETLQLRENKENTNAVKKRKKKEKKEKKGKTSDSSPEPVLSEGAGIEKQDDENAESGLVPVVKSTKKRRKEKNIHADRQEDIGQEDDARHKRILKKRDNSIKKAGKLTGNHTEIVTEKKSEETTILPEVEEEVHDLVPLPQPEPVPEPPPASILASLPAWLASPIRVSPTSTSSFQDIGLTEDIAGALLNKGFNQAMAVQASVLPLLLPGKSQQPGDVLVYAATGSGKTLAYVLPMMEDISRNHRVGIQGLIVVPTRELVAQARQVCELCASAFAKAGGYPHRPIIGTAVGNETLQAEQDGLMGEELIFDPVGYDAESKAANAPWESSGPTTEERVMFPEIEFKDRIPGHIIKPFVKVDVLICTPGRLVEHLKSTPGFSIERVRWLAVDEADKLLDQSFQQWLDIAMAPIHSSRKSIQDRVRKVILSATMTTDIGQLTSLKLYRPKLVVLEGSQSEGSDSVYQLALPALLTESAVKVEDETIKPLYLIELLRRANLILKNRSDSSGKVSSETSSSGSASESDDDTSDSESDSDAEASLANVKPAFKEHPPRSLSSVLIFTKSNETAVRLSRLIAILCPSVSSNLGTLTSTTPRKSRQRTISSFSTGKITILVASDLVSRGLDLQNLAHVINYDVPTSLTSYIHRIGRTARAGKEGHAWTLFTEREGGWFWREIARNVKVQRVTGASVERVNITKEFFDGERQQYEDALQALEREASRKDGKLNVE